jgi:hypothetical protein
MPRFWLVAGVVAGKLSHKFGRDAIIEKGIWWKGRMAALQALHVLTFRMRWPQAPDGAPMGE